MPGRRAPGHQVSLFEHALRLHRENPGSALPRDGEPYPDDGPHRKQQGPRAPKDVRRAGIEAAAVLEEHFTRPAAQPGELEDAFCDVYVPIHHNEHIAAAAMRADLQRVKQTGRWLVRHSRDRCSAIVGLALLATSWAEEDIPLIQTIGLLSDQFSPLAARALERRQGGTAALMWLADRVSGWGRVYVVEALCRRTAIQARSWLLRRACDGDYLNGYFAGQVATAAHLHEAITAENPDDDLVDHTGRLLVIMTDCGGMGMTLDVFPPARIVLEAHVRCARRQAPTATRYVTAARLADYLRSEPAERLGWTAEQKGHALGEYLGLLDDDDWCAVARASLAVGDTSITWLAGSVAPRLGLRAFAKAADTSSPSDNRQTDRSARRGRS